DRYGRLARKQKEKWQTTFNYKFGYPELDYDNVITDSIFMNVALFEGDIVEESEVFAAYVNMNNFIAKQYEDYNGESKQFVVMNVGVKEKTETSAVIALYSSIGTVTEIPSELKEATDPFQYYDWWHAYGYEAGRCNGYNSSHPSSENAADQLERYIKTHHPDFAYLTHSRVYYVDFPEEWEYHDVIWDGNYNTDSATSDMYPTIVYGPDSM
ncbi:MAG: hypothetical protein PF489_11405, partial [Salinivirgaceae bacterium]|nr:hypothetical protein [Salinivirgaceae bacterium]